MSTTRGLADPQQRWERGGQKPQLWGDVGEGEERVPPSDTIALLGVESTVDQCTLRVLTCLAGRHY